MDLSPENTRNILYEYIENPNLRQHCLAVESIMKYFAKKYGEDETYWGAVGLLHDLDWEKFPDEHCKKTAEILKERGFTDDFISSIQSHGWKICTEVEPTHIMEKILFALDELSGLIIACVLVRPSKSIIDLGLKSVKKKWKQPAFAAGVDRDIITMGLELIPMELDEAILECIEAMKADAESLGLK